MPRAAFGAVSFHFSKIFSTSLTSFTKITRNAILQRDFCVHTLDFWIGKAQMWEPAIISDCHWFTKIYTFWQTSRQCSVRRFYVLHWTAKFCGEILQWKPFLWRYMVMCKPLNLHNIIIILALHCIALHQL